MHFKVTFIMTAILFLTACTGNNIEDDQKRVYDRSDYVLGTIVSIQLLEGGSEALLDQSFDRLSEIEELMSVTVEGSQVSKLNAIAGSLQIDETMIPFELNKDVLEVVRAGIYYGQLSGGDFDITMGPIINLWQIGTENAHIPSEKEIGDQLELVDYKRIEIDEVKGSVSLSPQMIMNLGGIAKGYAADEVAKVLLSGGVTRAIINLGGNVKVIGEKAEDQPFRIGIQNPFDQRNDYFCVLSVADQTIVTSGDYERYFEEEGVRYHHIFDRTGYPVRSDVASVTVVAVSSIDADALSTILFIQGVDKGIELVNQIDGVECIYVMKNNEVYLSSEALKSVFRLTDEAFHLAETK